MTASNSMPFPADGPERHFDHRQRLVPVRGVPQQPRRGKHGNWADAQRLQAFGPKRDLPVLGRAQGGKDGNIVMEDNAMDWTFRPADLQGVKNAFAVYVTGDSMVPKYKNQDLAYVHPTKPPRKGRFVLVETSDHTGFIKQFIKWDGMELVLKQFNPAREIRLAREKVLRVLLVIGSLDS